MQRNLTSPSRRRSTDVAGSPQRSAAKTNDTRYDYLNSVPQLPSSTASSTNHPALRAENERLKMELESKKRQLTRVEAELAAQIQLHDTQRKNDASQRNEAENTLRNRLREAEAQLTQFRTRTTNSTAEIEELRVHSARLESDLHEARLALELARQQAARGLESAATAQRFLSEKQELQEQLKIALAADKSRVLEGKVEALTQALDEQLSKFDQQGSQVTALLGELELTRREKRDLESQLQEQERLQGEWIAVTDELRYRLRKQEEIMADIKETAARDVAAVRKLHNEKDDTLNAMQRTVDELHTELRTFRRQSNANDVRLEENNSQLKLAKQEVDMLRRELTEARREATHLSERLRQAHAEREASDAGLAKERTVADSLSAEVKALKAANAALEQNLDDLREDFHESQRILDSERSKFNVEHQKLLAVLGTTTRATPAPGKQVIHGVLSPQRPIAL